MNAVKDVPDAFKDWVKDNAGRIKNAQERGTLPYFIRDNKDRVDGILARKQKKTPLEIAAERHAARTPEQANEIKTRAWDRQLQMNMPQLNETERKAIVQNWFELERQLGIKKGRMMTHEEANTGRVNPNFGQKGFNINCSTCSATYILRRMGFNVQAKANISANPKVEELSYRPWRKWKEGEATYNSTAKWMWDKKYQRMSAKRYEEFISAYMKEPGTYEFVVIYKGNKEGHSTLLRKLENGKIERIEQQHTRQVTLLDLLDRLSGNPPTSAGIMRVDNAIFIPSYSDVLEIVK